MRRGFTLVECLVAGMILALVATAVLKGFAVVGRVANENAQYLEADAIVWDALAEAFTNKVCELDAAVSVQGFPGKIHRRLAGDRIVAWVEWNGQMHSNELLRACCKRGKGK